MSDDAQPFYSSERATLFHGSNLDVVFPDNTFDTIITDPPYGLSFMGKGWDKNVPGIPFWAEFLRVAKPGAFLLAFGGTRTFHRMACAIEDAGWEMRDTMMWLYGSGFPKSLDISKALDKEAGVSFEARPAEGVGFMNADGAGGYNVTKNQLVRTGESTPLAKLWNGWGTALKPAFEPIIVAMKPMLGTYAENARTLGVSGLNIDGARVGEEVRTYKGSGATDIRNHGRGDTGSGKDLEFTAAGRWPANVIFDEEAGAILDAQAGIEASRFFYCAKASKSDRNTGLPTGQENKHPTVKPIKLMEYLCTLTKTPTGGLVFDPFMGSGSTGVAALSAGREFVGIDLDIENVKTASARIAGVAAQQEILKAA